MKRLFLLSFTLILLHLSALSYASFPIFSDTTQIQKETLEEYQTSNKNQVVITNKNSVIYEDSKIISKSKWQHVLLIIALVLFLLFQLYLNAWQNFEFRF